MMAMHGAGTVPRQAGSIGRVVTGMLRQLSSCLLLACAASFLIPVHATENEPAAPADQSSAAEQLLFESDHLAGLDGVSQLTYRFVHEGDEAYTDRITLALTRDEHGLHVMPDFLSGDRHIGFPGVDGAHGNPLLLYFLEADLRDMQRQTQGKAEFFRRVVRRALAAPDLKVEDGDISLDGRQLHVQRVKFYPYHSDPRSAERYPDLRDKVYEFVFSDAVPGRIVSLQSSVSSPKGSAQVVRVQWTPSQ